MTATPEKTWHARIKNTEKYMDSFSILSTMSLLKQRCHKKKRKKKQELSDCVNFACGYMQGLKISRDLKKSGGLDLAVNLTPQWELIAGNICNPGFSLIHGKL